MKHSIKAVNRFSPLVLLWFWACNSQPKSHTLPQAAQFISKNSVAADSLLLAAALALESNDSLGMVFVARDMEALANNALDTLRSFSFSDSTGYLAAAKKQFECAKFIGTSLFIDQLRFFQPELPTHEAQAILQTNDSIAVVWEKGKQTLDSLMPIFLSKLLPQTTTEPPRK